MQSEDEFASVLWRVHPPPPDAFLVVQRPTCSDMLNILVNLHIAQLVVVKPCEPTHFAYVPHCCSTGSLAVHTACHVPSCANPTLGGQLGDR